MPLLNSKKVQLLDQPRLINQLCPSLERRTVRGGRDSIDHAPGSHDDVVNAVAGCLVRLATVHSEQGWLDYWNHRLATAKKPAKAVEPVMVRLQARPHQAFFVSHPDGAGQRVVADSDGIIEVAEPYLTALLRAGCQPLADEPVLT
jgi:hypothetical protein